MNIQQGTYLIIRTDGTEEVITGKARILVIEKQINATCLDTVLIDRNEMIVMLVDDNGYETREETTGNVTTIIPVKALKPVNEKATAFYHAICIPGTTHQIVGDVAIAYDSDFI